ncbi:MAG: response regulator transcription factor [Crocinitomicaceae bacterium]|nr:response regulator transcription factor [Crocinitomicaceae bacterium]
MGAIREALSSLTKAELNTPRLVSETKSSKEIAELLFVTEKSEKITEVVSVKLNLYRGSNTLHKWTVSNRDLIK